MGQYNQAVITTAGQGLLAGVIASGKALAFTNAKTSTHIYPSGLEALTDITDVMQTDAVSSATVMSNTQVKISTRFTNEGITAAYDINTIGIFAKAEGDATDTLFAVITAVTPDAMPKYTTTNPVAYIYDITVGMSNADSITLNVSPTGTPSYGDLAAAQTAAENASAANLAPAYDSTATYAKDDFCVNGGKLYQCNADISTAEAFNPAHWTEVKVTEVMGGGGGVTPEIMAQIENAQWKTETSEQLFSETVTTTAGKHGIEATLSYTEPIDTDTLKVTFNGVEYTCTKHTDTHLEADYYGAPYNSKTRSFDFSEYPFNIRSSENKNIIITQTPGTFTVSASIETVTTTDTFKQAVNDIAGWKTESSEQLFSETVTTVDKDGTSLEYTHLITKDTIVVTFDGVDYTCPANVEGDVYTYGAPYDSETDSVDYSEYPFSITSGPDGNYISTENIGTHTVSVSAETTTYTDAFKKGVNANAFKEVNTLSEADVAIVNFLSRVRIPLSVCAITGNGNSASINISANAVERNFEGEYIFWRASNDAFVGNNAFIYEDSDALMLAVTDVTRVTPAENLYTFSVCGTNFYPLTSGYTVKYYNCYLRPQAPNPQ